MVKRTFQIHSFNRPCFIKRFFYGKNLVQQQLVAGRLSIV